MMKKNSLYISIFILFLFLLSGCNSTKKEIDGLAENDKKKAIKLLKEISPKVFELSKILGRQYKIKLNIGTIEFNTQANENVEEEDDVEILWAQFDGGCEDEVNQVSCEGKCPCN